MKIILKLILILLLDIPAVIFSVLGISIIGIFIKIVVIGGFIIKILQPANETAFFMSHLQAIQFINFLLMIPFLFFIVRFINSKIFLKAKSILCGRQIRFEPPIALVVLNGILIAAFNILPMIIVAAFFGV